MVANWAHNLAGLMAVQMAAKKGLLKVDYSVAKKAAVSVQS